MSKNEFIEAFCKDHLKYDNEEDIKLFMENKSNELILSRTPDILNKRIVVEVTDAHGCASQYKIGDCFFFDGSGNLIGKKSPEKLCIFALAPMGALIKSLQELVIAGVSPAKLAFSKTGCSDVGVKCGGWGKIVMEARVEDRQVRE
jgi:uncharacterized repeat protein (TIGR04076 family)